MKIDIREHSTMSTTHGDRIEQLVLQMLDAHALILHTLAHLEQPDRARLKAANDRICDLIQKLYHNHTTDTLQ